LVAFLEFYGDRRKGTFDSTSKEKDLALPMHHCNSYSNTDGRWFIPGLNPKT